MTETSLPEPQKPTLRRLFFGDDGLRAGWSFALYLLIFVGLSFAARPLIHHLMPAPLPKGVATNPNSIGPRITTVPRAITVAVMLLAAWIMSRIERRPFARYGLSLERAVPDFFIGLFWGFATLSLLIGGLLATHAIAFDGLALHGTAALAWGAKWAVGFLAVGFFEEFFFRGYLQYTVARGVAGITRAMDPTNRYAHLIGFWVTASIFSILIFMLGHIANDGETALGLFTVGLAGAVFAFALYRTGTLWWIIGLHASWDWAQSFFYGTPDSGNRSPGHFLSSHAVGRTLLSGGTDGPEGSILVIPTLLLVALIIHLTLPRRPYPLTPDQSGPAQAEAPNI